MSRAEKPPRWVYPTPDHPFAQRVWRVVYRKRHRRFMAYLQQRLEVDFQKRMWSEKP